MMVLVMNEAGKGEERVRVAMVMMAWKKAETGEEYGAEKEEGNPRN